MPVVTIHNTFAGGFFAMLTKGNPPLHDLIGREISTSTTEHLPPPPYSQAPCTPTRSTQMMPQAPTRSTPATPPRTPTRSIPAHTLSHTPIHTPTHSILCSMPSSSYHATRQSYSPGTLAYRSTTEQGSPANSALLHRQTVVGSVDSTAAHRALDDEDLWQNFEDFNDWTPSQLNAAYGILASTRAQDTSGVDNASINCQSTSPPALLDSVPGDSEWTHVFNGLDVSVGGWTLMYLQRHGYGLLKAREAVEAFSESHNLTDFMHRMSAIRPSVPVGPVYMLYQMLKAGL
ncbi:hypothetical protein Moror_14580 [Moniliophthora roreri MCA 2997]|uniref:Uncharacterized protein n=2 Tax=Moniliophthora roreri TaxID=221103 RepID=V2X2C2_MONRO|nr:hypothetical protein Moror_14580 [Moniliophthora roreri MCA 2997]